jgi:hypothetical protein
MIDRTKCEDVDTVHEVFPVFSRVETERRGLLFAFVRHKTVNTSHCEKGKNDSVPVLPALLAATEDMETDIIDAHVDSYVNNMQPDPVKEEIPGKKFKFADTEDWLCRRKESFIRWYMITSINCFTSR